eukprot:NODE_403_length_1531_cov_146.529690_g296_i0.p1 GENE.NODE_403_length_1531_cov_146.529690_g296_i0~~NODE_403_length_1531_cov_146.529690_g296_i0.p1  ORF type:complete len:451 (+),score=136.15 NODE_403_length_1531_cov_146.529690_g296_i0:96-1448(+)
MADDEMQSGDPVNASDDEKEVVGAESQKPMSSEKERPMGRPAPAAAGGAAEVIIDDSTMDDILDKLRLMEFETKFCQAKGFKHLTHAYFARPAANPNEQFFYFTSLTSWLMTECGSPWAAPGQFEDPNATSTNVIYELKNMGFNVASIQPGKLRQGHGDAVLLTLTLLCDKALKKKGFEFAPPVYAPDNYDEEVDVEDDGTPETVDDAVFYKDSDSEEEEYYVGGRPRQTECDEEDNTGEIKASVDPEQWRMELERVAPQLKLDRRQDMKDWRSHVDWITTLMKTIDKVFPDAKVTLEKCAEDISKALEKIQKREQSLSTQFEGQVEQFRAHKKDYNAVNENFKVTSESVNHLASELNQITDMLENVKAEIQSREEAMTDTSPVVKIKEAMQRIRHEIKQMELRIGVLQHTVMLHKIKQAQLKPGAHQHGQNAEHADAEGFSLPVTSGVL